MTRLVVRCGPLAALALVALAALWSAALPEPAVTGPATNGADVAWMLTATALVLLMTPGLSFFYGGMVDRRHVISTMLQSFVAMGVVTLLWVTVGFSLAFGDSLGGWIGDPRTFLFFRGVGATPDPRFAATIPLALFALFQLKFAIITPALITGSFAGRVRFSSYILFMILFVLGIYCPLAHWTWHPEGWLRQWGLLDFAGGTVVHVSAGMAALAGAIVLGPRHLAPEHSHVGPANIPDVMLGTGMLWFGWFGFNAGSALSASSQAVQAFATTNTASAAAALTWMAVERLRGRRPSAIGLCVGAVVGLVAVTPAAGFVSVPASLAIGVLSAAVSNVATAWTTRSSLDDTLDVFPCHGVGGMVGMLATAVFAQDGGLITGQTRLLTTHVIALPIVAGWIFLVALALYWVTDRCVPLRVSRAEESLGLDLSQHGETLQPWSPNPHANPQS